MKLSVYVQPTPNSGFRAWCGEPVPLSVEAPTRDEALARLRAQLEARVSGVELEVVFGRPIPTAPIWPDDEFTRAWLEGIAAARAAADQKPDPWDVP